MINKVLKSNFWKSILMVMGGTTFAQALNILLSPVITRIYTPTEYGILTTYTAIISILAVGALKYELALPIAKDERKAINILTLCLLVLTLLVLLLSIVFLIFGDVFLTIFKSETLYQYRFLIPLGVLLAGLYKIFNQWAFRLRDYKNVTRTLINQSILSNTIKVGTGALGAGPIGLVFGHIAGMSAGIRVLSAPVRKRYKEYSKLIHPKEIKWAFKRYKNFPFYNMPSIVLMSLSSSLPVLYFTSVFSSSVVGFYGLAYTIVKLPMNLIGTSVANVFYAEAANIGKEHPSKLKRLFNRLFKKIILIGLLPLIALLALGPQLFSLVFGEKWTTSGEYARIIAFMIFFMFIFAPSGKLFVILEKQRARLLLDILRVVLVLVAFGISWIYNFNPYLTITMYTIVMSVNFIFLHIVSHRILNASRRSEAE
ncbi:lipopolysaccharide biosynthesis protein [Marinococcus luteus]|uniref:lipopolysaccharide biosynthesis protein n=1 Tax=Marinococcus luteus TaxID=1122204 RepID=UPI002ACCCE05|nr:oligosaccharide flippase family protein [Marinococcus luteus]MDZ5782822.1 oligosaccharide flippase family protein [Marinococcus luteus]